MQTGLLLLLILFLTVSENNLGIHLYFHWTQVLLNFTGLLDNSYVLNQHDAAN